MASMAMVHKADDQLPEAPEEPAAEDTPIAPFKDIKKVEARSFMNTTRAAFSRIEPDLEMRINALAQNAYHGFPSNRYT